MSGDCSYCSLGEYTIEMLNADGPRHATTACACCMHMLHDWYVGPSDNLTRCVGEKKASRRPRPPNPKQAELAEKLTKEFLEANMHKYTQKVWDCDALGIMPCITVRGFLLS